MCGKLLRKRSVNVLRSILLSRNSRKTRPSIAKGSRLINDFVNDNLSNWFVRLNR